MFLRIQHNGLVHEVVLFLYYKVCSIHLSLFNALRVKPFARITAGFHCPFVKFHYTSCVRPVCFVRERLRISDPY